MPIGIARDDEQRRITVTVSDPWSVEEILRFTVDRQLAEQVWTYGTLYDLRGSNWVPSEPDVLWLVKRGQQQIARHGARGPVAVLLDANNQAAVCGGSTELRTNTAISPLVCSTSRPRPASG